MGRLVAVALDEQSLRVVEGVAHDLRVTLSLQQASELRDSEDVEAVVLGEDASAPRALYRCQASAPRTPIVVIAPVHACAMLAQAVRTSPFGGKLIDCVPTNRREELSARLTTAIQNRRRRDANDATLSALNRKLEASPGQNRAEAVLDRLLQLAPIGVIVTDGNDRIAQANPRAQAFLGGSSTFGAQLREYLEGERHAIAHDVSADASSSIPVVRTCDSAGRERYVELAAVSIAPGSPGHLVVVQDVSERHALLSELRAANRAKDDFIAMLGHELRNPLAPIRTAVDLMRLRQGATVGREVAVIERHVKHMVQLIDDLLDVTRIVKGKLELRLAPVDLFDVVRDAIEMSSPLFEQSGHRLDCDVPRGLVVSADSGRLTQIIANLLMNAAKYTPPQGHVEIVGVRSGGAIELVVRDNGPGIAEEIRAHIFDLFVQERQSLDRSRGGLGLGLAIVKSLAALHGGDVSLDSEIGRGSTFTLRLPPLATDKVKEQRAPERTAMARLAGVRVLVVDDNEDAARSLGESLRMAGAVVDLAHDGPGALRIAAVNAPAVVLADLGLPVIDGYELAERLHARLPHVPIIAISGYGDVHDVERAARAGFVAHVLKPVSLPELTALVCSLVPTRSS